MSMKETHKALYSFWSQFGVKAYLSGEVPTDALFPYITFNVEEGSFGTATFLTAFTWHKTKSYNVERTNLLDLIRQAIPESGTTLKLDNDKGLLKLERNTATFMSYYDDADDKEVKGSRISYQVSFYNY